MPAKAEKDIDREIREAMHKLQSLLGTKGGLTKSDAKAAAARENGKRGGRPKKSAAN